MSTSTIASSALTEAHKNVYEISSQISDYLSGYEGTGITLSLRQIAEGVGINLSALSRTDRYLYFMSAEAAIDFRGWSLVSDKGQPAEFTKKPTVTVRRKPSASPAALRKVGR